MSDQFERELFDAMYAGIAIDVLNTEDDFSRTLIAHEFAQRQGAVLEDTGSVPRSTRCTVIFVPRLEGDATVEDDIFERFRIFVDILTQDDRTPQVFTHPITGTYDALPRNISMSNRAEDRDWLPINVTFVEAGLDPAGFQINFSDDLNSPAATARVGAASTDVAMTASDAASQSIAVDAISVAEGWRDDASKSARQINLELNGLANRIEQTTTDLQLATDISQYPTLRAFNRLHGALRRAASAAIRSAPKLQELTVDVTQPLLTILQTVYKGKVAVQKFNRVLELNSIPNPAKVVQGTTLTIESP